MEYTMKKFLKPTLMILLGVLTLGLIFMVSSRKRRESPNIYEEPL
jgi:LPXTG-motif cell wall-anchored protein